MILDNHVTGLYIDREFIAQFVTCYTGGIVVIDILIRTYIDITVFTGSAHDVELGHDVLLGNQIFVGTGIHKRARFFHGQIGHEVIVAQLCDQSSRRQHSGQVVDILDNRVTNIGRTGGRQHVAVLTIGQFGYKAMRFQHHAVIVLANDGTASSGGGDHSTAQAHDHVVDKVQSVVASLGDIDHRGSAIHIFHHIGSALGFVCFLSQIKIESIVGHRNRI